MIKYDKLFKYVGCFFSAHSPDNTFLGFIAGKIEQNQIFKKKDIAVIYGKLDLYLPVGC